MNPRQCHGSDVNSLGASWWYAWSSTPPCSASGEFIPMIWGRDHVSKTKSLPSGSQWLLGFNEPNLGSQANMSPQECARLWPQLEATGRKLVSPAMAMSGTAVQWMQTFLNACKGCRVDAIAIHLYETSSGGVSYWVNQFKKFNKPIWITEIAHPGYSAADAATEARQIVQLFESDSHVQRYSWFMNRGNGGNLAQSSLVGGNGQLT